MTDGQRDRLSSWSVIALTFISVIAIMAGIVVAANGDYEGGVVAVVSGAIAGIVAIVLREGKTGA